MRLKNSLAAYLLDGAVMTFGTVIENALHERIEVGSDSNKKWVDKYTLKQLLARDFTLPREEQSMSLPKRVDGAFYDEVS